MSLLRSKAIRVFYSDNGTLSDKTETLRTWGSPNFTFSWVGAEDALYIGRPHKFSNFYVAMTTPSVLTPVMTAYYWDGTAWVAFTDILDETAGFSASGFIQWEEKGQWQKKKPSEITGLTSLTFEEELYWIKLTLATDTTASTVMRALQFLLSDDRLMVTIHPEVMNYLPTGFTDWLPQHELAKNSIVNELIVNGQMAYEEQIKNVEDWILACTYRCIELILDPIVGDERLVLVKETMKDHAKRAIRLSAASIDTNKNEILDPSEADLQFVGSIRTERR